MPAAHSHRINENVVSKKKSSQEEEQLLVVVTQKVVVHTFVVLQKQRVN